MHNFTTGKTIRVSSTSSGAPGNEGSFTSAISANGDVVAFSSEATNLVPGDTQPLTVTDVFVYTISTGVMQRVSVNTAGGQANGECRAGQQPARRLRLRPVDQRRRHVRCLRLDRLGPGPGDTNTCSLSSAWDFTLYPGECPDIFVRNLVTGVTERVSVDSTGGQSNDASSDPAISGDGSTVAFFTLASNLAPGDTNTCQFNDVISFTEHPGQCPDIYVHSG